MVPVAHPTGERPARPTLPRPVEALRNGDNLTRDEFERRYDAMPAGAKAELIDGVVYMPPPVSVGGHGRPQFKLVTILGIYEAATPGVIGADNTSVRLDLGSMPQPDICLFIDPALGGRVKIDADDYVAGSPELVVEIAASTASYDAHQKREAYRRNGVGEYFLWRTLDRAFDHLVLGAGRFDLVPTDRGVIRSVLFPGLWLDTAAMVALDSTAAMAELHRGLASPGHAAFVADLRGRAPATGRPRP